MVRIILREIVVYLDNETLETITKMFDDENGFVINQAIEALAEMDLKEHIENNINKILKN